MPLLKLQTVGEETREFLYENRVEGRGDHAFITLRPGIAFCFRSFHPLVVDLAQTAWARFIRRTNPKLLGERAELREFLFGAPRANLRAVREPLMEIQEGRCFYCERRLGGAPHVDHFVPWSRYPVDLGHNFVVAHESCNVAKADHLAAERHLRRWVVWQKRWTSPFPRYIHRTEVTGLQPDTEYEFRFGAESAVCRFRTMPGENLHIPCDWSSGVMFGPAWNA